MTRFVIITITLAAALTAVWLGMQQVDRAHANLTPDERIALREAYGQLDVQDDFPERPQGRSLELHIDHIVREYPVQVVYLDHERRYLTIEISGDLTLGSDESCMIAARLFHRLTSLDLILEVRGTFVPSGRNPMDLAWTRQLITGDDL